LLITDTFLAVWIKPVIACVRSILWSLVVICDYDVGHESTDYSSLDCSPRAGIGRDITNTDRYDASGHQGWNVRACVMAKSWCGWNVCSVVCILCQAH